MFYFWKQIGTYYNKLIPMKNTKFWDFEIFYFRYRFYESWPNFELEMGMFFLKVSVLKPTFEDYNQ